MTSRLRAAVLLCAAAACTNSSLGVSDILVVSEIRVSPPGSEVVSGGSVQLTAVPQTASGIPVPNRTVSWSSSDATTASVSGSGLVTGHMVGGPVLITATVDGVASAVPVTVVAVPVVDVVVEPHEGTVQAGGTLQLAATPLGPEGEPLTDRTVQWSSENDLIVSVDQSGEVTGSAPGGPIAVHAIVAGKFGTAQITVTPRPASRLGFQVQPTDGTAGEPLAPPVKVAILNAIGGVVTTSTATVTLSLTGNPSGATLGGTPSVDAIDGVATFPDLTLDKAADEYLLTAAATGLTSVESEGFDIVAAAPGKLQLTTQPSPTASSGTPFARQPVVQLQDANGNPVAQATVPITASLASGNGKLEGTLLANTNASGTATFGGLAIIGPVGDYALRFSSPGLSGVVSAAISLGAGGVAQLAIVTQPPTTARSGLPLTRQPVIQLQDESGNPVEQAGVLVIASLNPSVGSLGGDLTVATNSEGRAVFSSLVIAGPTGSYTLTFASPDLGSVMSNMIQLGAGPAARLVITVQPSATAQSGVAFGRQPVLQLEDASGNPAPEGGVAVTAAIEAGPGGTLGGTTVVVTDGGGKATFGNLQISGAAGEYTLRFSATGLTGITSATIELGAGAGSKLAILTQPSAVVKSGEVFPQQPVVALRDASDNPVEQGGVLITVSIQTGGGTLQGTASIPTDDQGVATFTNLAIAGDPGTRTLIFAASGFVSVASNGVEVEDDTPPPTAKALVITQQPSGVAVSGVAFVQQPRVRLVDGDGNPVSLADLGVTATIASGGGTLQGTTTVATDASGTAIFHDLAISGSPGDRTLRFESAGLEGITSSTISVAAPPPAVQLQLETPPSGQAQSGATLSQQPVVRVRDAGGTTLGGILVTATVTGGGATLLGDPATLSANNGRAAFTDLGLSGLTGDYTLTFSAEGAEDIISGGIALAPGPASQLTITTQPSGTAFTGVVFGRQPVIQLRDAAGNPVAQAGAAVTAEKASGSGTLGGTLTVLTDDQGTATFTDLRITGLLSGNHTIRFVSEGLTSVVSSTVTVF